MTCSESVTVQRPGSSDVEQLSEKDHRQAAPLIDAFDVTLVSYYSVFCVTFFTAVSTFCLTDMHFLWYNIKCYRMKKLPYEKV